jgi:hypothetical protein
MNYLRMESDSLMEEEVDTALVAAVEKMMELMPKK